MQAPNDLADAVFADTVFRVGRAYGMTADRSIYQAVAGQWIISSRCCATIAAASASSVTPG